MTHSNDSTTHEFTLPDGTVVIIDAEDWPRVSQNKWYALKSSRNTYVRASDRSQWPWRAIHLHRLILNAPDGFQVDHINHDGRDNRKCNLRLVTQAQNQQNRRAPQNGNGLKGAIWDTRSGKWKARIRAHKKTYHLGYYQTPEEAAAAYDEAAKRLHGEFASLNFPDEQAG